MGWGRALRGWWAPLVWPAQRGLPGLGEQPLLLPEARAGQPTTGRQTRDWAGEPELVVDRHEEKVLHSQVKAASSGNNP